MVLDYHAIGRRIKIARIRRGHSQEHLAELVGLSTGHMSNIETGSTKVSLKTLVHLANVLEVPIEELLADNVVQSTAAIHRDIQEILDDCDEYEIRALAYVISATKEALRKDRMLRSNS